jgi:hypothetical protein
MTARTVAAKSEQSPLHLWVLEQNTAAQAFYEAHGARHVGRSPVPAPGGIPDRLNGSPYRLLCAWENCSSVGKAETGAQRSRFT